MINALFVAWRSGDADNGAWGPVGRLDFDGQIYRFCYTQGARTLAGFRPFAQMDDLEQVYESDKDKLFPLFANRLLSPSRPEYEAFLRWSGFDPDDPPDPLVILGVTEGLRQTDSVEVFPCPIPDADGCYLNKFFLHGVRWKPAAHGRIEKLQAGEPLVLVTELDNPSDVNAVAVHTGDGIAIGYVPRYLAHDVGKLLCECDPDYIELLVQCVNPSAPLQQRLLCRMNACWPDGFQPCSERAFLPIPSDVPTKCDY